MSHGFIYYDAAGTIAVEHLPHNRPQVMSSTALEGALSVPHCTTIPFPPLTYSACSLWCLMRTLGGLWAWQSPNA